MPPEGYLGLICSPSHFFLLDAKLQVVDMSLSGGVRGGMSWRHLIPILQDASSLLPRGDGKAWAP